MAHVVVMGVSGSGKTVFGTALASALHVKFLDADDFHPIENIKKMKAGTPLDDEDRWPWLQEVGRALSNEPSCVMACSALKLSYRNLLRDFVHGAIFVHLNPSRETLLRRLSERRNHFMGPELLESQLMTLEPLSAHEKGILITNQIPVKKITSITAKLVEEMEEGS